MIDIFKTIINVLSTPTVSFTILTILIPFIFPPSDWFEKWNRRLGLYKLWTKTGCALGMGVITFFFIVGYFDPNFNITLTKPDNFPIVLMIYSMFFFIWLGMYKAHINDERLDKGAERVQHQPTLTSHWYPIKKNK